MLSTLTYRPICTLLFTYQFDSGAMKLLNEKLNNRVYETYIHTFHIERVQIIRGEVVILNQTVGLYQLCPPNAVS